MCVPANPVDTGQAEHKGAVYLWEATRRAAQERLDATLAILRGEGLRADGAVGDYRPMVAMDEAVAEFRPDRHRDLHPPRGAGRRGCATTSWSGRERSTRCRWSTSSARPRRVSARPERSLAVGCRRAPAPHGRNNGTYSSSQTRSGTCSRHGGVAEWLSTRSAHTRSRGIVSRQLWANTRSSPS